MAADPTVGGSIRTTCVSRCPLEVRWASFDSIPGHCKQNESRLVRQGTWSCDWCLVTTYETHDELHHVMLAFAYFLLLPLLLLCFEMPGTGDRNETGSKPGTGNQDFPILGH